TLKVAVNSYREFGGGGFPAIRTATRLAQSRLPIRWYLAQYLAKHPDFDPGAPSWTVRPGWASRDERPLIDLMVRQQVIAAAEAMVLEATHPVSRRTFQTWLTKAMGAKLAAPPAATRAGVTDPLGAGLKVPVALDLCERTARLAGYALTVKSPDRAFR